MKYVEHLINYTWSMYFNRDDGELQLSQKQGLHEQLVNHVISAQAEFAKRTATKSVSLLHLEFVLSHNIITHDRQRQI